MPEKFRYVYGPVPSWRLGRSLGIDLLSGDAKICNFDCVYCQLGHAAVCTPEREIFAPTKDVIKELKKFTKVKVDYITFSGMGEPTLAKNLGAAIKAVKKIREEPVAVLTNSSFINNPVVRKELMFADFVIAKLDGFSGESLRCVNRPHRDLKFSDIFKGLKKFRRIYKNRLAIQVMFVDANKKDASRIARICRQIKPDEVQINTPLRPCVAKALSKKELSDIKSHFKGLNAITVYEARRKKAIPISHPDTIKRRGKT